MQRNSEQVHDSRSDYMSDYEEIKRIEGFSEQSNDSDEEDQGELGLP